MSFWGPVAAILVFVSCCADAQGGAILREVYSGISGSSVASLTNHASYPNSPSSTNWLTDLFETPVNVAENYGQRVRGYIVPPQSGFYTFWIASDDNSELWLSTNAAPATNYVRIAYLNDWANPREWTKYGTQQSAPIFLEAGKLYAIYALMKEGGGGDNLAVRWQLPDGDIEEPIPATHLLPPGGPFVPPQLVGQSDTNVAAVEGGVAEFWVATSNLYPLAYQWQRNGTNIAGASASNLVLNPVLLADSGSLFRCVITNSLGAVTSAPCVLAVSADTNAPAIAGAYNVGTTLVYVAFSEPVASNAAVALANYAMSGGVNVLGAALAPDQKTVALTVSPLTLNVAYTLTASNIADRAAAPNTIAPGAQWVFTARDFAPAAIGSPAQALQLSYLTNGVDLTAGGAGFGGDADEGALNYVLRTGDFDVRTRLQGMDLSDVWAKAGIMARATLDDDSDYAAAFATPTISGAFFEYRKSPPNLLANPGFEDGQGVSLNPAGWNGDWYAAHALTNNTLLGGGTHRAPVAARSGTWMLMVTNNVNDSGNNWHGTAQFFPCSEGRVFVFTSWYLIQSNLPSQHATFLKIEWYDANTNRLFTNEAESSRVSSQQLTWAFSAVVAVAPAGAAIGKVVYLYEDLDFVTNSPAQKFLAYWDDASLWEFTGDEAVRGASQPVNNPDTWLRLKRQGNFFTGFLSYDGDRWTELGAASNALPSTVYLGMAAASRSETATTTARFRDWGDAAGGSTGRQFTGESEPSGPSSRRTSLVISEIMYNPAPRQDGKNIEFIELFNTAPYAVDLSGWRFGGDIAYTFPSNAAIRAGGFLVVARVPADIASVYGITNALGSIAGNLPNGSGQVSLYNNLGGLLLDLEYGDEHPWPAVADGDGPSLVLARPSYGEEAARAWAPSALKGGSPGALEPIAPSPYASIKINEVLAHTDLPQEDFVELFNAGATAVDVSGFIIRVDTNNFAIPASTVIAPRGFVAFNQTQLGFVVRMEGARVRLLDPQDTRVVDMVLLGATSNGVSTGRFPDGAPNLHELATPTLGTNNSALLIRDIVINEIMFHAVSNSDSDEYVELFNRGTSTVDISGWRLSDGITFTFPANTIIPPGGFVVAASSVTNLLARYPQLSATNTFGNFSGRLSDRADRVALEMPEDPLFPSINFVLVDEVVYSDGWGKWSDGDGSSLELIDAHADNRLAGNWMSSDESVGSSRVDLQACKLEYSIVSPK